MNDMDRGSPSDAAWRLHLENARLRARVADLERVVATVTRCVYCGTKTTSMIRVCPAHHDLARADADFHTRPVEAR